MFTNLLVNIKNFFLLIQQIPHLKKVVGLLLTILCFVVSLLIDKLCPIKTVYIFIPLCVFIMYICLE